jgi:hypothetical protein
LVKILTEVQTDSFIALSRAASFITAKGWNQPSCPSMVNRWSKCCMYKTFILDNKNLSD